MFTRLTQDLLDLKVFAHGAASPLFTTDTNCCCCCCSCKKVQ
jgi:uridylate kinase